MRNLASVRTTAASIHSNTPLSALVVQINSAYDLEAYVIEPLARIRFSQTHEMNTKDEEGNDALLTISADGCTHQSSRNGERGIRPPTDDCSI